MPYSGNPATSLADELRFLLGDTGAVAELSDTEVTFLLTRYVTARTGAAHAADYLAAKYAGQVNRTIGALSISASTKSAQYRELAASLRATDPVIPGVAAGGLTDVYGHDTTPFFTRNRP